MLICMFKISITSNVDSSDIVLLGYIFLLTQLCLHMHYSVFICQLMDVLITIIMKPRTLKTFYLKWFLNCNIF